MRRSRLLWAIAGAAVIAAGVFVIVNKDDVPAVRAEFCSAKVDETYLETDLEQARYASLIAAIGTQRGLPARASSIAIATAYQESKVRNIDFGDRDSIGLFQQRPSQGWGSKQQIMDPHYSIGKFFSSLVEVDGYQKMEITDAAQRVQRSAYGGAYAQHGPYSRALASALTGYSPAAFSCQIRTPHAGTPKRFHQEVRDAFGPIEHETAERAVHYPVPNKRRGWALAHYAVANAKRLGVTSVEYDGRRWTARKSPDGWVAEPEAGAGRVHVTLT